MCLFRTSPLHSAGLALGLMMSRSTRVREDMFLEAAKALARLTPEDDAAAGALVPTVTALRDIAGGWAGRRSPCDCPKQVACGQACLPACPLGRSHLLWLLPPAGAGHATPTQPRSILRAHPRPAAHVSAAVAQRAYTSGVATELPKPHDLLDKSYSW